MDKVRTFFKEEATKIWDGKVCARRQTASDHKLCSSLAVSKFVVGSTRLASDEQPRARRACHSGCNPAFGRPGTHQLPQIGAGIDSSGAEGGPRFQNYSGQLDSAPSHWANCRSNGTSSFIWARVSCSVRESSGNLVKSKPNATCELM